MGVIPLVISLFNGIQLGVCRLPLWEEVVGATPALVSVSLWDGAAKRLNSPRVHPVKMKKYSFLLTGFTRCSACGGPVHGRSAGRATGDYFYYKCRQSMNDGHTLKSCDQGGIRARELEAYVWDKITHALNNIDLVMAELRSRRDNGDGIRAEIAKLEVQRKRIDDQELRLIKLVQYAEIDEDTILKQIKPLKRQKDQVAMELLTLQERLRQVQNTDSIEEAARRVCGQMAGKLEGFGFDERRLTLEALGVRILIGNDHPPRISALIPVEISPNLAGTSTSSTTSTKPGKKRGLYVELQ